MNVNAYVVKGFPLIEPILLNLLLAKCPLPYTDKYIDPHDEIAEQTTGPNNKMAAPVASVHPGQSHLSYAFSVYPMNGSCSQMIMLLTSLSKTLLASYSSNVSEVEPPFCEHRCINSNTQREGD